MNIKLVPENHKSRSSFLGDKYANSAYSFSSDLLKSFKLLIQHGL